VERFPSALQSDFFESRRALLARLRQHGQDIRSMTTALDDSALDRRFDPEKWSLKELVCHVWRVQQLFELRIDRMLESDVPAFASYTPDGDQTFQTLVASYRGAESVQAFLVDRERFAGRLGQLSALEWWRQGRHPLGGHLITGHRSTHQNRPSRASRPRRRDGRSTVSYVPAPFLVLPTSSSAIPRLWECGNLAC
jgi:hypothetical protein